MLALVCVRPKSVLERKSKIRACTIIPAGLQIAMPAPTHTHISQGLADEARFVAFKQPQRFDVAFIGQIFHPKFRVLLSPLALPAQPLRGRKSRPTDDKSNFHLCFTHHFTKQVYMTPYDLIADKCPECFHGHKFLCTHRAKVITSTSCDIIATFSAPL